MIRIAYCSFNNLQSVLCSLMLQTGTWAHTLHVFTLRVGKISVIVLLRARLIWRNDQNKCLFFDIVSTCRPPIIRLPLWFLHSRATHAGAPRTGHASTCINMVVNKLSTFSAWTLWREALSRLSRSDKSLHQHWRTPSRCSR